MSYSDNRNLKVESEAIRLQSSSNIMDMDKDVSVLIQNFNEAMVLILLICLVMEISEAAGRGYSWKENAVECKYTHSGGSTNESMGNKSVRLFGHMKAQ